MGADYLAIEQQVRALEARLKESDQTALELGRAARRAALEGAEAEVARMQRQAQGEFSALARREDLSDKGKQQAEARLRGELSAQAKLVATRAWQRALAAEGEVQAAIKETRRAHEQSQRWDYQRLDFLSRELAAKLGNKLDGKGPLGPSTVERIQALRDEYTEVEDRHALRALALVARPLLDKVTPGHGTDWTQASELRRQFDEAESSEVPGLAELVAEGRDLGRRKGQLRQQVLELEATVTGHHTHQYGPIGETSTPWHGSVLGERAGQVSGQGGTG